MHVTLPTITISSMLTKLGADDAATFLTETGLDLSLVSPSVVMARTGTGSGTFTTADVPLGEGDWPEALQERAMLAYATPRIPNLCAGQ